MVRNVVLRSPEIAPYDPDPIHVVNPYRMKTKLYACKWLLLLCIFVFSGTVTFGQQVAKTISYAGANGVIGFLEFKPTDYGSQKHPLIIFMHGIGERGDGTTQINNVAANGIPRLCAAGATMRFTVGGQTSSFVVLSPQLYSGYGAWQSFYVTEMIKYAKANLQIDTNRIYVTGLSLGGGGAWIYAFESYENAKTIAALAPVCGTDDGWDANACVSAGAANLPIWAFHCKDDGTVAYTNTQHVQLVLAWNCGVMNPAPRYSYYLSGGHSGAWNNAFDTGHITRLVDSSLVITGKSTSINFKATPNLYEWFLMNSRAPSTGNTPPVASAGSNQTITLPTNSASLSGSGTGTNGATISTYAWTQTSGPGTAGFGSAGNASTTVTGLIQGTYVFTLTVTDNNGLSNSATVTVTVNPANTPPVANAGSNQTITLPTSSASLSGSGTGTNGATISTYAWTQTSGPNTAGITTAGSAATTVTGLIQGAYVFTLTVTDNHGLTNSATVSVTVNPAPNTPPVANAGSNQTIQLPASSATLSGSGTGTNGATISTYAWTQTSGPNTAGISTPGSAGTTVTGLIQGTYVFTLTVTDNHSLTNSATVSVTVNPAYTVPSVSAGGNQTIQLPASSATLTGSGTGTNGATISTYAWTQTSGPNTAGITTAGSAGTTVTGLIQGTYVFTLTVTDNHSLTNSATVSVTVNPAYTAPSVSAGGNQTIQLPTNSATLTGSGAGTNGATISTYAWTQTSGPNTAGITTAGNAGTTVTGLIQGVYDFTLTVTDNHGLTSSATVGVTVNPAYTAPSVSAGGNQTIQLPANTATLTGSGTGTNGATISTYAWTQTSGPNTAGITTAGSAGTTVTGLIQGTYVFKLTVTDNHGLTNSATVSVTVNAAYTAPVASAGGNQTIQLPTSTATLSGSGAGTNGASVSTYAWTQDSGPNTAGITTAGSAGTTVTGLVQGSYVFTLTVTDNHGLTNSASVTVTVNPANTAPIANAGSNQTIQLPASSATLSGSGSGTNGATISSYAWTQTSGPNTATITTPGSAGTTVTGLIQGTYVFTLTVTDNHGLSNSSGVTVIINPTNTPPSVSAGGNQIIQLPVNSASLGGSGTGNNGATISGYAWTQSSGPNTAGISTPGNAATTVTGLIQGAYTFTLTVTDNNGLSSSASVTVTVNAANTAPIANAGSNQTIQLPVSSVTLSGSGAGTNGATISSYAWTQTSGPNTASITSAGNASTGVSGLLQGTYVFTLTVTDNHGLTDNASVTITVNPANTAPVANAGSNQTIQLPVSSATLNGSGTGTNGATISSYAWVQTSGPNTASVTSAGNASTGVSGLIQGAYIFTLTVTDNHGLINSASVTITVNPANTAPVANAGSNQTIQLPVNSVTLNGSGAGTNGATISSYAWVQTSGPNTASIASAGNASTGVSGLLQGTYVFMLTVTDNNGLTDNASVTITVNPANTAPVANAGGNQTIQLPASSATLSGSGTGTNGATISTYAWVQTSGPNTASITSAGNASAGVSGLIQGVYVFTLTVTDNHGLGNSASVTITVIPANTAPVANAGSDQTIQLPVNSVSLGGNGTGTNGATISSYAWTQTSGPNTAGITTAGSAGTTVTGLIQGTYIFTLTVTDNHGLSNSASVTITVTAAYTAPSVSAGSDQTIRLPLNTVSLTGSGAGTNGATINTYVWAQASGPAMAGISTPGSAATTVTGLAEGVYVFNLTVTDNHGLTSGANVVITVLAAYTPPIADAGSDQNITLPVNAVILNGSGAGTNGASISSYAWTQTSGPSAAGIGSAATAGTSMTGLVQGLYVFTLTVTDNHGLTGSSNVIIVVNPAHTAPIANAGNDQTITLPTNTVTLSGSGTGTTGATISSYAWTQTSGPNTAGISTPANAGTTVTGLIEGVYIFTLTVTDNHGLTNSAGVTITVKPVPNTAPVADAGKDTAITQPASLVVLNGSASYDPDGSIVKYSWNKISGTGAITILYSNTTRPTVIGLQPGVYIFELTVTDNKGAVATDQVQVTVNGSNNKGPVADAGRDTTVALPYSGAILNGKASTDPDGRIVSYVWSQLSGPTQAVIAYPLDSLSAVTGLQEGQYVFRITVTDNEGFTDTASVMVTVTNTYRYTQYFRIYPNPVATTMTLEYIDDHTGKVKVSILDEGGRVVLLQELSKDQSLLNKQIDVSHLRPGMYFIQLEQAGSTKLVRPFVKQ